MAGQSAVEPGRPLFFIGAALWLGVRTSNIDRKTIDGARGRKKGGPKVRKTGQSTGGEEEVATVTGNGTG